MIDENDDLERFIPVLQTAIFSVFEAGDWTKFAYKIGNREYFEDNDRLYNSLYWKNDDYENLVFQVLEDLVLRDYDNFCVLVEYPGVKDWIRRNEPPLFSEIYEDSKYVEHFESKKISPKQAVINALTDAKGAVDSGNPRNAVDRVHTALHGYFQEVCEEYSISYGKDDNLTKLYKQIRNNVAALNSTISHPEEVKKILVSLSSCVDTLNTLRNNASIAHPNDNLIGNAEATLAINVTNTILHYIDGKLS